MSRIVKIEDRLDNDGDVQIIIAQGEGAIYAYVTRDDFLRIAKSFGFIVALIPEPTS